VIGEQTFTWGPKDIFVVPQLALAPPMRRVMRRFSSASLTVPCRKIFGFWREERADTSYPYDTAST